MKFSKPIDVRPIGILARTIATRGIDGVRQVAHGVQAYLVARLTRVLAHLEA